MDPVGPHGPRTRGTSLLQGQCKSSKFGLVGTIPFLLGVVGLFGNWGALPLFLPQQHSQISYSQQQRPTLISEISSGILKWCGMHSAEFESMAAWTLMYFLLAQIISKSLVRYQVFLTMEHKNKINIRKL